MADNENLKEQPNTGGDLRLVPSQLAAGMLGVSARTFQRLAKSGAVPTVRMSDKSGARWVPLHALCAFVAAGGVKPSAYRPACR